MKKTIRRLGLGETWLALLHDKAGGTAQTVLTAEILGKMNESKFIESINYILKQYPQLTYTLELSDDGYYLIQDEITKSKINIECLLVDNEMDWMLISQHEANATLAANKNLFRAKCLLVKHLENRFFIILTIHHSISDGLSLPALLDSLLNYYNQPGVSPQEDPNPGPIDALYSEITTLNQTVVANLRQLNKIKLYQWQHQTKSALHDRVTHFIYCYLTPTELQSLLEAAKHNQVTINAILNAAMLLSAQRLLKQGFNAGLSTPVGLRNQTNGKANQHDVGFLLQVIDTVHPNINETTSLITLASEYNKQLKEKLSVLQIPRDYDFRAIQKNMFEVWDPTRDYFCYNFMVTNLGFIKFENESNHFQVKAMRFITCRRAADNNMMLYVNSINGGCFYTFGYPYPSISHEWANTFVKLFNNFLLNLPY